MNEIRGDFWEVCHSYDALCCTTNLVVKSSNGNLVMGAGIAKQFAQRFPCLPRIWGRRTEEMLERKDVWVTPIVTPIDSDQFAVAIPTKIHWRNKSDISLIKRSIYHLAVIAKALGWKKVLLTRPGCGNGGLNWETEVKPNIEKFLDDKFDVIGG